MFYYAPIYHASMIYSKAVVLITKSSCVVSLRRTIQITPSLLLLDCDVSRVSKGWGAHLSSDRPSTISNAFRTKQKCNSYRENITCSRIIKTRLFTQLKLPMNQNLYPYFSRSCRASVCGCREFEWRTGP